MCHKNTKCDLKPFTPEKVVEINFIAFKVLVMTIKLFDVISRTLKLCLEMFSSKNMH